MMVSLPQKSPASITRQEWEWKGTREGGGGGREREQWRSKPVMAAGGCSPPPARRNPFSTHSFLTYQLTLSPCFTHKHICTSYYHSVWVYSCSAVHIHSLLAHTPLLFWSFIQRISRNLHQNIPTPHFVASHFSQKFRSGHRCLNNTWNWKCTLSENRRFTSE